MEVADLADGIGQQVAEDFVLLAHTRANIGKIFDVDMAAVAVAAFCDQSRRIFVGLATLPAKQVRQLSHDNASNPGKLRKHHRMLD